MSRYSLFATLFLLSLFSLAGAANAQTTDRAQVAAEIESLREQIKSKESLLLAPSNEDKEAYAEFLQEADTGLIRLLPREKWDGKLSLRGGGAYYSFTKLTHEYGDSSDISLEQNSLSVGFHGADFGFLTSLGNVPLEQVTLEQPAMQFLTSFVPPSRRVEIDKLWASYAGQGLHVGDLVYKHSLPAVAGNTYLLRSISYDDADSLVALRVVRKDADDSIILVWKMLKRSPKPKLERDKVAAGM